MGTMEENMEVVQAITKALKAIDPEGKVTEAAEQEAFTSRKRPVQRKSP
jgi:hypothetical protein